MTNNNSEKQHDITMRTTLTGEIIFGSKPVKTSETDIRVLSAPKKTRNGSNGTSEKDKHEIIKAVYYLIKTYGHARLSWLILTFDESLSDEGLINLLNNFDKLKNKVIKRYVEKGYTKEFQPWLVVYGLRSRESFKRKLPCYDVNILLLHLDEEGKPLFDLNLLIKSIYASASKLAKETIPVPLDIWKYHLDSTHDPMQTAHYFAQQVDLKSFKALKEYLSEEEQESYLLSQWATVPKHLKSLTADLKDVLPDGDLSEVKLLLKQEKFASKISSFVKVSSQKVRVKLNQEGIEQIDTYTESIKQEWEKSPSRSKSR